MGASDCQTANPPSTKTTLALVSVCVNPISMVQYRSVGGIEIEQGKRYGDRRALREKVIKLLGCAGRRSPGMIHVK